MKLQCIKNTIKEKNLFSEETVVLPLTVGKTYEVVFHFDSYYYKQRVTVFTDNQEWKTFSGDHYLQLFKPLD